MRHGVGIVEPAVTIMNDFHIALDTVVAHDGVPAHLNPHDG